MAIITYLTQIRFGYGTLNELPDDLAALGIKRPLVVADKGIVAAGLVERLFDVLSADNRRLVFDDVPTNPTEEAALQAVKLYRDEDCDGLIALGGGSAIDLAKAVGLLATHPEPLSQYAMVEGGVARIMPKVAPLVAIPTTSGTGSEVGRGSVMNLSDGRKLGIISPNLIPKRAICDPELTLGLPPWLTAATGMDALPHCIESFLTPNYNPPAEGIALDGARRRGRAGPRSPPGAHGRRHGGRHDLPEGPRRRSRAVACARLAEGAAPPSRHAQRGAAAAGAALQRRPCRRQVPASRAGDGPCRRCRPRRLHRGPQRPHRAAEIAEGDGRAGRRHCGDGGEGRKGPHHSDEPTQGDRGGLPAPAAGEHRGM